MCGILAALFVDGDPEVNRRKMLKLSKLLRHRGPDANSIYQNKAGNVFLCHERLNIIDASDCGRQPFVVNREEGDIAWIMNSEIYNHKALRSEHLAGVDTPTSSDSYVPGAMFMKYNGELTNEMIDQFDGIFAMVVYDEATNSFTAARDPMGICPMYWGKGSDGSVWFSSEMKAIQSVCEEFEIFPPGHVYRSQTGKLERWYNPQWLDMDHVPTKPADLTHLRETLVRSVVKRLMSDAPLGVLLSGGLDSSLVASIAVRHIQEQEDAYDKFSTLHTFSIGIEGSPDLAAAQRVADFLGTKHHGFTFTVEEGIDALRDLIWHIESYEQVRAAVPMYLLSRKIKAMGIKVVLSGEGADELYGGYLYFHKAPNAQEFHRETIRKTMRLHQWDVMRANKAPFAWGLEPRVPFLDKDFIAASMEISPGEKMCNPDEKPDGVHPRSEKYLLRKAFDTPDRPYLPDSVLWRQKEQFSDGVGYDWVDALKDYAEKVVTDEMWEARESRFPEYTPTNKEYYLLRSLFEEQFPSQSALATVPHGRSVACSTPEAVSWDPEWEHLHDISGRAVQVHNSSDGFAAGSATGTNGSTAAPAAVTREVAAGAAVLRQPLQPLLAARPRCRSTARIRALAARSPARTTLFRM